MTIYFGKDPRRYKFEGPYSIKEWEPPYRAAIYSIMMRPDPKNKPNTFQVLYFGESSNLSERGLIKDHHKYECFVKHAGSEDNLYIAVYLMPESTQDERRKIEQYLISVYNPPCNAE